MPVSGDIKLVDLSEKSRSGSVDTLQQEDIKPSSNNKRKYIPMTFALR